MFLHHTMTDAEILRTCDGCQSPHLQFVSSRLRDRVDDMRHVHRLAIKLQESHDARVILEGIGQIVQLTEEK